jgi:Fur family ferric uptake transcriptional regulator
MKLKDNQTKVRNTIDECFEVNSDKTINFNDINNYLLHRDIKVNKTTIYRYLDKLVKNQQIKKYLDEDGKQSGYVLVLSEHCMSSHLHMKCVQCNKLIHLNCDFNKEILDYINNEYGFEVDCKQTVIYGLCEDCKK